MIYLDNAATSLIKPASVEHAVINAMRTMASPGRGAHEAAMRAADEVLECRLRAAELFNVKEAENVIFTMNATHALNIAIKSLARRGSRVLISGFEHNSVLRPLRAIGADIKICGRELFNPEAAAEEFRKNIHRAELAVCTHVSNVFGYILPIEEIAGICKEAGVPLIVDASQSAGSIPVDMQKLSAAFIAMPGHKGLFGPQGTGILLCGREGMPLIQGGSGSDSINESMPDFLPDRLEAGTHNVCGIAGLRAGIEYVIGKGTENILRHEQKLLKQFKEGIKGFGFEVFTDKNLNQAGLISLRHPRIECEELAEHLSKQHIAVRSGLQCAPLAHMSAGTIKSGTLRFSFSPFTTPEEIEAVCAELGKSLKLFN